MSEKDYIRGQEALALAMISFAKTYTGVDIPKEEPDYRWDSFEEWAENNENEFELYCDAHTGWKAARELKE